MPIFRGCLFCMGAYYPHFTVSVEDNNQKYVAFSDIRSWLHKREAGKEEEEGREDRKGREKRKGGSTKREGRKGMEEGGGRGEKVRGEWGKKGQTERRRGGEGEEEGGNEGEGSKGRKEDGRGDVREVV